MWRTRTTRRTKSKGKVIRHPAEELGSENLTATPFTIPDHRARIPNCLVNAMSRLGYIDKYHL